MPQFPSERLSIREWAADDRPRERLLKQGPGALSDAELLAILIRTGTREASAVDMAKGLLHDTGNDLVKLGRLGVRELMRIKGLKEAKAITIVAAMELGRRRRDASPAARPSVGTSASAFELLHPVLGDLMHEEFWLLLLDRGNRLLERCKVSEGGLHGTVADPKRIFRVALERQASSLVLAHNHPSGRAVPSEEDIKLTRKLVEGGRFLDITVQDHLIVTVSGYYSFADNGAL